MFLPQPTHPRHILRIVSVTQIVLTSLLLTAAPLEASTAYVSICCNAPSTVGVFSASNLVQTRSIVTGSGGDSLALSPDGTKMFVTVDQKRELQVISTPPALSLPG
jgi:hypothetical protein